MGWKKSGNNTSLQKVNLDNWQKRRLAQAQDEPDCIQAVDGMYGHECAEPSNKETLASIQDIIIRAAESGVSKRFIQRLSDLILVKHKNL